MLAPRAEFAVVILGTIFVFIGVAACGIAAVRRGNTGRDSGMVWHLQRIVWSPPVCRSAYRL